MTVPVQTPYNSYTYAGSATFVYGFQIILATDLQVSVAGVVQPSSNYTISGVGIQTGGSILYTGPLTIGQLVEIQRVTSLQRGTDYQNEGDFLAATINADIDRVWMALQEQGRTQVQSVRVPEAGGIAPLPAAAARAGYLWGFDGAGNFALVAAAPQSASALALALLGNNGSTFVSFLQGGTGATLRTSQDKMRERVSVKDFGATGDGTTDDTSAIQRAFDYLAWTTYQGSIINQYLKGGGTVHFPPGVYKITDTIRIGSNTNVTADAATGDTGEYITTHTGAVINCVFADQHKWAFSSATYETGTGGTTVGAFAAYNVLYTGAQNGLGAFTLTQGITIRGLNINCNGAYGGIRLLGASGFSVRDCLVHRCGVGYLFNTCYGGSYDKIMALHSMYGGVVNNCTALSLGHAYYDKQYSYWTIDASSWLVDQTTMGTGGGLPSNSFGQMTYGLYVKGSYNLHLEAQTTEHGDVGIALDTCTTINLHGYGEANATSDFVAVASSGIAHLFANATTGGIRYHFGSNNNFKLERCTRGAISVGGSGSSILVDGEDAFTGDADWTWNDAITFQNLSQGANTWRVAAAGTTTAVEGYLTLDEAVRRISISKTRHWTIYVKDGDTVTTAAQRSIPQKSIVFTQEGTGTVPTISAGAAGGGFIYRWTPSGDCDFEFIKVNIAFPASPAAAAGDSGLFLFTAAATMRFAAVGSTITLGAGYSLFQVTGGAAVNMSASWSSCTVTAGTNAPIMASGGAAVVTSTQGGTTVAAGIKALGTNGWVATTVLASNF